MGISERVIMRMTAPAFRTIMHLLQLHLIFLSAEPGCPVAKESLWLRWAQRRVRLGQGDHCDTHPKMQDILARAGNSGEIDPVQTGKQIPVFKPNLWPTSGQWPGAIPAHPFAKLAKGINYC